MALQVGWQEGYSACKTRVPRIPKVVLRNKWRKKPEGEPTNTDFPGHGGGGICRLLTLVMSVDLYSVPTQFEEEAESKGSEKEGHKKTRRK